MSGGAFRSYSDAYSKSESCYSSDHKTSEKAWEDRRERINYARSLMGEKTEKTREQANKDDLFDRKLVTRKITAADSTVERLHVVMIDNSGSNAVIARLLRESAGYFMATLNKIDPGSQVAFMYCSDHCDHDNFIQEIDFLKPDENGVRALFSSSKVVDPANGGDAPEGFECSLKEACEINFNNVKEKHLYLVTDVVAHGMGMAYDDGCPYQVSWKETLKKVRETFTSFEVIGCGNDPEISKLQHKFVMPERLQYDYIDLSAIPEARHRAGITGNALLFLMARHRGFQAVEMFLSFLYEKWLEEPIFGKDTDSRAKEMISRFSKFVEGQSAEKIKSMLDKIIG